MSRKHRLRNTRLHVARLTIQTLSSVVIVVCLVAKSAPIYRPRQPRQSPLFRTIERYLPEFEWTYDRRYAKHYGPWRPIIGDVARRFLRCGDLHYGFARVRCHEMFVAFSCGQRCLCPSCHQKRTLMTAETIAGTICAPVPHRQLVFTIPNRMHGVHRKSDGRPTPQIFFFYQCSNAPLMPGYDPDCPHPAVRVDRLETFVIETMRTHLMKTNAAERIKDAIARAKTRKAKQTTGDERKLAAI